MPLDRILAPRPLLTLTALLAAGVPGSAQIQAEQPSLCTATLRDEATGQCLEASSVPALGMLFPMTTDLMVDSAGRVGIGTASPQGKLDVTGNFTSEPIVRVVNTSTSPFTNGIEVASGGQGSRSILAQANGSGAIGVEAISTGTDAAGVFGIGTGGGYNYGVLGLAQSAAPDVGAVGVHGYSYMPGGEGDLLLTNGVLGQALGGVGTGVFGVGNFLDLSDGVRGEASHPSGFGVYGRATGGGIGVVGEATGGGTAILASGDLVTTGVKNFAAPHPTDPSLEIRFVCLEGNEPGTYFRGSSRLVGGEARIQVPEEFRLVSAPDELTVQLTAVGAPARLWVVSRDLHEVVVRGDLEVDFDYQVNGIRASYRDYQVVRDNRTFRPRVAGQPFGAGLSEGARQTLVRTGVLNPDFTPDRATAARLGWNLVEASEGPAPRPPAVLLRGAERAHR